MKNTEKDKKTEYAAQNALIGMLKEDGVLCNPFLKEYKEDATDRGGVGDRKIFKRYNDIIIEYHNLLSVLTGEKRANIFEEIPVIDFLHKENTGFDHKYLRDSNNKIIPSSIQPIESSNEPSINLILKNDPYTINRALIGEEIAEHFYNTSSIIGSLPDLQTSPFKPENISRIYRGIPDKTFVETNGIFYKNLRRPILYIYKGGKIDIDDNLLISIKNSNPDFIDSSITNLKDGFSSLAITIDESIPEDDISHPINIIKNITEGVYPLKDISYICREVSLNNTLKKENYKFLENFSDNEGTNKPTLKVNLSKNDIYVIIPKVAESDVQNIILLFKYVENPDINKEEPLLKNSHYKVFIAPISSYSIPDYLSDVSGLYTIKPGDEMPEFLFNIDNNLDKTGSVLKIIRQYVDISIKYFTYASGLLNGLYSIPRTIGPSINNHRNIETWEFINDSEIINTKGNVISPGTKYFPGHLLNRGYFLENPLKLTYHDYHDASKTYNKTSDNKWEEIDGPFGKYIQYPVDSNYYKYVGDNIYEKKEYGLNLYKFERISPSSVDKEKTYYKVFGKSDESGPIFGKAGLLLDLIEGKFNGLGIFENFVEDKDNWLKKINKRPLFTVNDVILKSDYSREHLTALQAVEMGLNEKEVFEKDENGKDVLKSNMIYPNKFKNQKIVRNGVEGKYLEPIKFSGIEEYIKSLKYTSLSQHKDRIKDGVLYLSTGDSSVCGNIQSHRYGFDPVIIRNDTDGLENNYIKSFRLDFTTNFNRTDNSFHSIDFKSIKLLYPLEAFCQNNEAFIDILSNINLGVTSKIIFRGLLSSKFSWGKPPFSAEGPEGIQFVFNPNYNPTVDKQQLNILVSPDDPNKFPEKMFLFSKDDLGLSSKSGENLISFYSILGNGKLLLFSVEDAYYFNPSSVHTLSIYDPQSSQTFEIPKFTDIYQNSTEWCRGEWEYLDNGSLSYIDVDPRKVDMDETLSGNLEPGMEGVDPSNEVMWNQSGYRNSYGVFTPLKWEKETVVEFIMEEGRDAEGNPLKYAVKKKTRYSYEIVKQELVEVVDNFYTFNFKDCYIYTLKPMNISLSENNFYTQFDSAENEDTYDFNDTQLNIFPVAYPSKDYFPIIRKKDPKTGQLIDEIKDDHKYIDFKQYLNGSIIIPSLPRWNPDNPGELDQIKTKYGYNLTIFKKLILEEMPILNKTISNELFIKILGDWQITDGYTENNIQNPLTLRYVPDLIDGLSSLPKLIESSQDLNFKILKTIYTNNGSKIISENLNKEELKGLENRLNTFSNLEKEETNISKVVFKINSPTTVNTDHMDGYGLDDIVDQMVKDTKINSTSYLYNTSPREPLSVIKNTLEEIFYCQPGDSIYTYCDTLDNLFSKEGSALIRLGETTTGMPDPTPVFKLKEDFKNILLDKIILADKLYKQNLYNYIEIRNDNSKKAKDKILSVYAEDYNQFKNELKKDRTEKIIAYRSLFLNEDFENLDNERKDQILANPLDGINITETDVPEDTLYDGLLSSLYLLNPPYGYQPFPYNKPPYQPEEGDTSKKKATNNGDPNFKVPVVYCNVNKTLSTGEKESYVITNIQLIDRISKILANIYAPEKPIRIYGDDSVEMDHLYEQALNQWRNEKESLEYGFKLDSLNLNKANIIKARNEILNDLGSFAKLGYDQFVEEFYLINPGYIQDSNNWNFNEEDHSGDFVEEEGKPTGMVSYLEKNSKYDNVNKLLKIIEELNLKEIKIKKLEIFKKFNNWLEENPISNLSDEDYLFKEFLKRKPKHPDTNASITLIDLPEKNTSEFQNNLTFKPLCTNDIKNYIDSHLKINVKRKAINNEKKEKISIGLEIAYPKYETSFDRKTIEELPPLDKIGNPSSKKIKIETPEYTIVKADIQEETLKGLADFIITSLEGTNPKNSQKNPKYVEYTHKDKILKGRQNSLYYRRYQILNNRMNKIKGPLGRASILLYGRNSSQQLEETASTAEIYKDLFKVIPIEKINKMNYLERESQVTLAEDYTPQGKYYYKDELNALKSQIGDNCLLTCTKCSVKDTCPYYNEDGILKRLLNPVPTIDFWFKDNELDLLWYEKIKNNQNNAENNELGESLEKMLEGSLLKLKMDNQDYAEKTNEYEKIKKEYENIEENYNKATGENKLKLEELLKIKFNQLTDITNRKNESLVILKKDEKTYNDLLYKYNIDSSNFSPDIREVIKDASTGEIRYGARIPEEDFKKVHNVYADVIKKQDANLNWETYNINPLEDYEDKSSGKLIYGLRSKLKNADINYNMDEDNLGRLIGARYGTVEKNSLQTLFKDDNKNLSLPSYKYLYDAAYIADTKSEFAYSKSKYKYRVTLDKYNDKKELKHYEGSTYIKIPYTLKSFENANNKDKVYFVSDDTFTKDGKYIDPVIYLGTIESVRQLCEFDLGEPDTLPGDIKEPLSGGTYSYSPWDVAQWSVNYLKGNLENCPLNMKVDILNKNNLNEMNLNRDQYWMPTIEKLEWQVDKKTGKKSLIWKQKPGRLRSKTKWFEPLMESGSLNPPEIISGKPVTANYFNFIRRMSIRIWDDNKLNGENKKGDWTIPWVDEDIIKDSMGNSFSASKNKTSKMIETIEAMKEYKRKILPNMITNPRLVIVSTNI